MSFILELFGVAALLAVINVPLWIGQGISDPHFKRNCILCFIAALILNVPGIVFHTGKFYDKHVRRIMEDNE
jgi:hypothetical protein